MKLLSSIATLSCTSIMAVCSLGANAEIPEQSDRNLYNRNSYNREAINEESAIQADSVNIEQQSHFVPNNSQNNQSISYNVFSLIKDRQITLDDIGQDTVLENVEWYIEKFDHINL